MSVIGLAAVVAVAAGAFAVSMPAQAASSDLLSLNVRDSLGHIDAGATVRVTAWPNSSTLNALPVGATVKTTTLAAGHTDSFGDYSLRPDLSSLDPATYQESGGAIHLEVDIADSHGYRESTDFSAAKPASADAASRNAASVTDPETMTVDFETSKIQEKIGTAPGTTYNATPANSGVPNAPGDFYCLPYKKTRHIVRNERFYNLYATGKSKVSEEAGASHSVAVGANLGGNGWGISAKITIDTTSGAGGVLGFKQNHTLYNAMNVAKFDRNCYSTSGGAGRHDSKVYAIGFHDLMVRMPGIVNRAWNPKNCTLRHRGDWYKTSGRDQTFSAGITTPWIDLSARAGYSKNMRVDWYPRSVRSGEYLCGSNWKGFASAPFGGGYAPPSTCPASVQKIGYSDGSLAELTADGGKVDDSIPGHPC